MDTRCSHRHLDVATANDVSLVCWGVCLIVCLFVCLQAWNYMEAKKAMASVAPGPIL